MSLPIRSKQREYDRDLRAVGDAKVRREMEPDPVHQQVRHGRQQLSRIMLKTGPETVGDGAVQREHRVERRRIPSSYRADDRLGDSMTRQMVLAHDLLDMGDDLAADA